MYVKEWKMAVVRKEGAVLHPAVNEGEEWKRRKHWRNELTD
jgi:hypothetical protein